MFPIPRRDHKFLGSSLALKALYLTYWCKLYYIIHLHYKWRCFIYF